MNSKVKGLIDDLTYLSLPDFLRFKEELKAKWGLDIVPYDIPEPLFEVKLRGIREDRKIQAIKGVRTVAPLLRLVEAKELVEDAMDLHHPTVVSGLTRQAACEIAATLDEHYCDADVVESGRQPAG